MKKLILFSTLSLTTLALTAADFSYGLCTDAPLAGFGVQTAGANYTAAIEVPAEVAAQMVGSSVTDITFGFHSGMSKVANVYLSYDLDGEPFFEQSVKGFKAGEYTSCTLDKPYVIEGKKFYIGYTYHASTASGSPVGFDYSRGHGNPAFSHVGVYAQGGPIQWFDTEEYGNLAISATISGDNLPTLSAIPTGLTLPEAVSPEKEFSYSLAFTNLSTEPINSIEVVSMLGSDEAVSTTVTLDTSVAPGADGSVRVSATSHEDTLQLPVVSFISKVNGSDNPWGDAPMTAYTVSSDDVFPRVVVGEEFTGTTCPNCPRGLYSMEILEETFPDTFIGIEVHTYSSGDPMFCRSYVPWTNLYGPAAPYLTLNRKETFGPEPGSIVAKFKEHAGLVKYKVDVTARYANDSHTSLDVDATTTFAQAYDNHDFALAFVLTEDKVGPYTQLNNFAGGSTEMGGWEKYDQYHPWVYTGVAREIFDWQGREGTIPASVSKGDAPVYSTTLPISEPVKASHANTNVIALLIDRSTREILTAGKCHITDAYIDTTGVDTISSDTTAEVIGGLGTLRIEGHFNSAEVYTMAGVKAASLASSSEITLPAGIYAVRILSSGKTTVAKVAVR